MTDIPANTPQTITSYFTAIGPDGNPVAGVTFTLKMVGINDSLQITNPPPNISPFRRGIAVASTVATAVSDENGLVQFPGTISGCNYLITGPNRKRPFMFRVFGGGSNPIPNFIW